MATSRLVPSIAGLLVLLSGCSRGAAPARPGPPPYTHPDYARLSRAELLIESQRKGVMGRKRSLGDVRRVVESIGSLVADSVRQPEIAADLLALAGSARRAERLREDLRSLQEGDLLLESGGDPDAVSSAGAVGVAQWLAGTARWAGLRVDTEEYGRVVARARRIRASLAELRRRPAEWARPMRAGGPALSRDQWIAARTEELRALERHRLAADERYDPRKAILAQTRYLVGLWRRFGSFDWALQAYHGGVRGAERTRALYGRRETGDGEPGRQRALPVSGLRSPVSRRAAQPRVSFEDVYFGISPRQRVAAFSYVYGRADDHRYYWWRVLMAERAIRLCREDPARFRALWRSLAPGHPLDRAWYPAALAAPFADVAALQDAYPTGILLPIPDSAARLGFAPRSLAPLDAANERWYRGLRPEALGMLQALAALYREEGGKAPLRVVGAATTVAYARLEAGRATRRRGDAGTRRRGDAGTRRRGDAGTRRRGVGADRTDQPDPAYLTHQRRGNAGTAPRRVGPALTLHAAGLCVDVARPSDRWDRKVLEYALSRLGDRMRIAWLRDLGEDSYHLCPNPAFAGEFRAELSRAAGGGGAGR